MYRYPCARKNRDNAAPNNIPYATTMGKVTAWVRLQWTTGDRWNRVGTDRKGQVVQKDEEQHFEGRAKWDWLINATPFSIMKIIRSIGIVWAVLNTRVVGSRSAICQQAITSRHLRRRIWANTSLLPFSNIMKTVRTILSYSDHISRTRKRIDPPVGRREGTAARLLDTSEVPDAHRD